MPFEFVPMTVAPGQPPVAPGVMPQFIQWRYNGVDLGGPDATTVHFIGDFFLVTRGAGAEADTITVTTVS